jgi:hypothetical protein
MIPSHFRKALWAVPLAAGSLGCAWTGENPAGFAARSNVAPEHVSAERLMAIGRLLERQGRLQDAQRVYAVVANRGSEHSPTAVDRLEMIAAYERKLRGLSPDAPAALQPNKQMLAAADAVPPLAAETLESGVETAVARDLAAIVVQTNDATEVTAAAEPEPGEPAVAPIVAVSPAATATADPQADEIAGAASIAADAVEEVPPPFDADAPCIAQQLALPQPPQSAADQLLLLLRDEDAEVRLFASYALTRLQTATDAVVPVLGELVVSDRPGIVSMSALLLGELGPAAADALPSLRAAFYRTEGVTQLHTADAVLRIAPGDQLARMLLLNSLHAPDARLRRTAAEALAALAKRPDQAVVRELTGALTDAAPAVREQAALTLMQFGPAAQAAVPVLRHAFQDADDGVRAAAAGALARIQPALASGK